MKKKINLSLLLFLLVLIFVSVGFKIIHSKKISSGLNQTNEFTSETVNEMQIQSIKDGNEGRSKNESVFIKKDFYDSQGSAYYVMMVLSDTDRITINLSKEHYLEFWKNEIINTIKEFSLEEDVYNSIKSALISNEIEFQDKIGLITILTASINYDAIEVQLLPIDNFAYSISIKYYSPL